MQAPVGPERVLSRSAERRAGLLVCGHVYSRGRSGDTPRVYPTVFILSLAGALPVGVALPSNLGALPHCWIGEGRRYGRWFFAAGRPSSAFLVFLGPGAMLGPMIGRMFVVICLFAPVVMANFSSITALFQDYDRNGYNLSEILRWHTTTTMYPPKYTPYSQDFGSQATGRASFPGGERLNLDFWRGPTDDTADRILSLDAPQQCTAFPQSGLESNLGTAEASGPRPREGVLATIKRSLVNSLAWLIPRASPGPDDRYMQRIYVEAMNSDNETVYSTILTKDSLSLCALAESGFDPEVREVGAANGVLNRDRRDALGFWRRKEYAQKSLLREKQGFPRQATFFDSSEILRAGTSYTERCMIPFSILGGLADNATGHNFIYRLNVSRLLSNQSWENVPIPVEAIEAPVTTKNIPSFGRREYIDMESDESLNNRNYKSTFPLLAKTGDGEYIVTHQILLEINLFPCTSLDGVTKSYCAGVPIAKVLYTNITDNVSDSAQTSALQYPMPLTQVTLNSYQLNSRRPYRIVGTMDSVFMILSHASKYAYYDFPTFEIILLAGCLILALVLGLFKTIKASGGGVFSTFQGFLMAFSSLLGGATCAFCLSLLVFAVAYLFARPWLVGSGILTEKPMFFTVASGAGLSAFHYLFSRILQIYPTFSIVDWEGGRSASSILDTVNDERGMGGSSLWRREQVILMLRDLYRHRDVTFPKVFVTSMFILVGYDIVYQAVPNMQFSMTIGELDRWYTCLVFFAIYIFSFLGLKVIYFLINFFRKSPVEHLGDYLSLMNCSLFVFEGTASGFYIHGRAPCGTVEIPLEGITDGLQREARGLLPRRGLKQGTSLQYFRFYFRPNTTPTTTFLARVVIRLAEIGSPDPHVNQQMSDEDFNGTMSGELSVINSRPKLTVSTFSRPRLLKLNDVERGLENLASNVLAALPVTYAPIYHSLLNIPPFAKARSTGSGKDILLVADSVETKRRHDDGAKPPGGLGLPPWLTCIFPFGIEIKETLLGAFVSCAIGWELRSPVLGAGIACIIIFVIDFAVTYFWERKLCESTLTRRSSLL